MKERLFRFALNHPIWVILLTIVLVFTATSGAKNLVFKSDYRVFFQRRKSATDCF
jgi:predicted RND superfamily exporter protein